MKLQEHFDSGSLVVIVVTLVLFVVALFLKGLTHDLLLEAGVFLVSAKLIMMAYKSSVTNENWIPIETIVGDGSTNSVAYAASSPARFYVVLTP